MDGSWQQVNRIYLHLLLLLADWLDSIGPVLAREIVTRHIHCLLEHSSGSGAGRQTAATACCDETVATTACGLALRSPVCVCTPMRSLNPGIHPAAHLFFLLLSLSLSFNGLGSKKTRLCRDGQSLSFVENADEISSTLPGDLQEINRKASCRRFGPWTWQRAP
ncbi:hypothetical protein GUJ93_ZPchr0010g11048 [Zizania palustris]|uniref:Uncharacterized protein n=1 Tax=Zizania palustris TaxID=103762 RepID=A0A8J5WAK9_ZIZPA|nr:hypothetical protein GUJ93_ZPchr0010g11048 [Zizania palustris]